MNPLLIFGVTAMTKKNDIASKKYLARINEHLATTEMVLGKDDPPEKNSKNHAAQLLLATYLNRYRMQVIKRKYVSS